MIVRSPIFAGALRQNGLGNVCLSCSLRTELRGIRRAERNFSNTNGRKTTIVQRLGTGYFFANRDIFGNIGRGGMSTAVDSLSRKDVDGAKESIEKRSTIPATAQLENLPPHRRRRHKQSLEQEGDKEFLPENASTIHADRASALPQSSIKRLLSILLSLTKPRLSMLVVLTACSAYTLYPVPSLLSSTLLETPSLSTLTLLFLTTGTALCAASANTLNMLYEPKFDAQMSRTRNRPLVRKLISPGGALLFAIASGVVGVGGLYYGVNPTTAFLGALNIGLYAGVYTPLKRVTVFNTWVGAIVGDSAGGWLLAGLLFAWQLSHFMPLSWSIREEYKGAGYRMLCWVNPAMNGRVALRYSIACIPLCIGLCYANVTEWTFAAASMPVNAWLVREAYRFWKYEGQKGSAKKLFWASVWHLPVVLVLAMVEKKGLWSRILSVIFGQRTEDDEEWEYVDEDEHEEISVQKSPVSVAVSANSTR
ncbi:protoheme IX farnesyltransferase [Botrytis cinerea]